MNVKEEKQEKEPLALFGLTQVEKLICANLFGTNVLYAYYKSGDEIK